MALGRRRDDYEIMAADRRAIGFKQSNGIVPCAVSPRVRFMASAIEGGSVDVAEVDRPAKASRRMSVVNAGGARANDLDALGRHVVRISSDDVGAERRGCLSQTIPLACRAAARPAANDFKDLLRPGQATAARVKRSPPAASGSSVETECS